MCILASYTYRQRCVGRFIESLPNTETFFMRYSILEKFGLLVLLCVFCFGCSIFDSFKNRESGSTDAPSPASEKSAETAGSPCNNRFHPVKDGSVKNYEMNNPLGKSTAKVTQRYNAGEATFTEEWVFDKTTMNQIWQCTDEGIIAPNHGSALSSSDIKVEPRRISGVTLPPENEMTIGKTWTVVYESKAQMPSGMGETVSQVTVNNKIASLDDEVKTAGGTFKAAKVEMDLNIVTKINGKTIPVPPMKTVAWYAPEVGLVKSGLTEAKLGNMTMEYVSGN